MCKISFKNLALFTPLEDVELIHDNQNFQIEFNQQNFSSSFNSQQEQSSSQCNESLKKNEMLDQIQEEIFNWFEQKNIKVVSPSSIIQKFNECKRRMVQSSVNCCQKGKKSSLIEKRRFFKELTINL